MPEMVLFVICDNPRHLHRSKKRFGSIENRRQMSANRLVIEADGYEHLLFLEPQSVVEAPAEQVGVTRR
jgi:hypothetical protein